MDSNSYFTIKNDRLTAEEVRLRAKGINVTGETIRLYYITIKFEKTKNLFIWGTNVILFSIPSSSAFKLSLPRNENSFSVFDLHFYLLFVRQFILTFRIGVIFASTVLIISASSSDEPWDPTHLI